MTPSIDLDVTLIDLDRWLDLAPTQLSVLDEEERARASRFNRKLLADRYRAAHVALRLTLGRRLGLSPDQVRLGRRPCPTCGGGHGKPVAIGADLDFSLAHCDDRAIIAVSTVGSIGVDIEPWHDVSDVEGIARQIATQHELASLRASPTKSADVLRLWVQKEAIVKATGEGLAAATNYGLIPTAPAGWQVHDLDVGRGHVAALAINTETAIAPTVTTMDKPTRADDR